MGAVNCHTHPVKTISRLHRLLIYPDFDTLRPRCSLDVIAGVDGSHAHNYTEKSMYDVKAHNTRACAPMTETINNCSSHDHNHCQMLLQVIENNIVELDVKVLAAVQSPPIAFLERGGTLGQSKQQEEGTSSSPAQTNSNSSEVNKAAFKGLALSFVP